VDVSWQLRSGAGREFQVDGPAIAKLRGPYRSVLVAGTARSPRGRAAEHSRQRPALSIISDRQARGRQIAGCQVMQTVKHQH